MKKVVLKKGRDFSVRKGHPWIFSGALEEAGAGAEPVEVYSSGGERLGIGFNSPSSQIRVRMMPDAPVADVVRSAVARRLALLSAGYTDAVRLVNAENDMLPGVVADFYAGHVILQLTSAGAEFYRDEIADALAGCVPGCIGISERLDVDARRKEGLPVEPAFRTLRKDAPPELIEIGEGAARYCVDPRRGHKTGFYLDQRDARKAVAAWASGRRVLNCFSYTGGFGIAAAMAGAKSVVQVDSSASALELARKNAELNGIETGEDAGCEISYEEADVFRYLRKCRDEGLSFDLIILDPPKFAETKSQTMRASRGYKDINLLAMKLLSRNGILATFSCSGAMTGDLFGKVVMEAALDSGRNFSIVGRTCQPADHPVSVFFPEGEYLKGLVLRSCDVCAV